MKRVRFRVVLPVVVGFLSLILFSWEHENNRVIESILQRGAELDCRPLSVIVVEPGCKPKAFQKEDGSSMIRFEMAFGKAYAALALGRSSKLVRVRAQEKPIFMDYLIGASNEQIFPEGGGMLIRDAGGEVIGAVGAAGIAIRNGRYSLMSSSSRNSSWS